jgi:hypothetical protein
MSTKAVNELRAIVAAIDKNSFTKNDIASLLVNLRSLTRNKTIIDLANFHTHPEGRNQGDAHAVVQDWINKFIAVAESKGGTIYGMPPVFIRKQVIVELFRSLKSAGIQFSENSIKRNQVKIIEHIKELMVDSEFKLEDKRVARCWVNGSDSGSLNFNFQAKGLKHGVIVLGPGGTIAHPLFD